MVLKSFFVVASVVLLSSAPSLGRAQRANVFPRQAPPNASDFDWEKVNGTDDLQWMPCYDKFQCARLNVPLNYTESSSGQIGLAVMKLPASVSSNSSEHKGSVLVNPGGPGEPSVFFLLIDGDLMSARIGPNYDIIAWDTRGVGFSTPQARFFDNMCQELQWISTSGEAEISSLEGLKNEWARNQVLGKLVEKQNALQGEIIQNMDTEYNARDMLYISDKLGEQKINYYGISYGTILGATFATLFPDKVGKLVIGGVVDPDDYYKGDWTTSTKDTDKSIQWFYDSCSAAGKDACPFWASSPEEIKHELETMFSSLRASPFPVVTDTSSYGVITHDLLRNLIFSILYSPWQSYAPLARALADLQSGNGSSVWAFFQATTPDISNCTSLKLSMIQSSPDSLFSTTCNDAPVLDHGLDSTVEFAERTKNAPWQEFILSVHVPCTGWPKWPRALNFAGHIGSKTSPLLVLSNNADPVTPLASAEKVAKLFPGSVLLTQNAPGHSTVNAVTNCTTNIVRAYFETGALPNEGTICELDGGKKELLFPPINGTTT